MMAESETDSNSSDYATSEVSVPGCPVYVVERGLVVPNGRGLLSAGAPPAVRALL